jgi:hypothetical protein
VSRRSRVPLVVLTAIAALLVIFGIGDIQQGPKADPAITTAISGKLPAEVEAAEPTGYRLYDFAIRMGGLNLVVIGLLLAVIALIPYRAGRRWRWNAMWLLPALGAGRSGALCRVRTGAGDAAPAADDLGTDRGRRRGLVAARRPAAVRGRPRRGAVAGPRDGVAPQPRRRQFGRPSPSGSNSARIAR